MNLTSRLSTACPFCKVAPGEPCMGANGPRRSVHIERWQRKLVRTRKRAEKAVKEGDIRELLKARVESYGGEIRAVAYLGRKHCPDVLALFPGASRGAAMLDLWSEPMPMGVHVLIETKRPGKDATTAQAREHERLRDAGCCVLVIANEKQLNDWLPPLP